MFSRSIRPFSSPFLESPRRDVVLLGRRHHVLRSGLRLDRTYTPRHTPACPATRNSSSVFFSYSTSSYTYSSHVPHSRPPYTRLTIFASTARDHLVNLAVPSSAALSTHGALAAAAALPVLSSTRGTSCGAGRRPRTRRTAPPAVRGVRVLDARHLLQCSPSSLLVVSSGGTTPCRSSWRLFWRPSCSRGTHEDPL